MIPRRYVHVVYGVIQSGLTCAVAAAVATARMSALGPPERWIGSWAAAWLIAWATMIPVVLIAAPAIRRLAEALTQED
jgi:hypothetical protein